ncbi:hypothetical protein K402DRAFT_227055 [Aulographum hederae CBS 113979]|uniref:Uncharacterized protein n=1 Tax=Aulographum hederae CBS 113979 TaxID=1176131 RepID=A0A6G1HB84_9PEZI|nr:hypothetical protein K402DRAFT_227055 [Aulographum hederae CBS 113979]
MALYHSTLQVPSTSTRPHYGNCDSFFVESAEDRAFDRAVALRVECERKTEAFAKMKQRDLAARLSAIESSELYSDILESMLESQSATMPDVASIDTQTEIQWFMRPYLLDFLIEAHSAYNMLPETLHLAMNLLDRYCSKRVVYKRHYQLVGCAALLIACKYADKKERTPTMPDLRSMCCQLYEEDMFIQMEWHVLQTLDWSVGHATPDMFVKMALDGRRDDELEYLALYILELALFERDFISVLPAKMAQSAMALARIILGRPQPHHSEWYASYCQDTVYKLSWLMDTPSLVVRRKYMHTQWLQVATTVELYMQKHTRPAPVEPTNAWTDSNATGKAPMVDNTLGPMTPQKAYGTAYGLVTPPITPDSIYGQAADVKEHNYRQAVVNAPQGIPPSPTHTMDFDPYSDFNDFEYSNMVCV